MPKTFFKQKLKTLRSIRDLRDGFLVLPKQVLDERHFAAVVDVDHFERLFALQRRDGLVVVFEKLCTTREERTRARTHAHTHNLNFIHMNMNKPNRCEPPELIQFVAFLALSCARKREKEKNYFRAAHTKRHAQRKNATHAEARITCTNLASWTKQIERHKRLLPRPNVLGTTVLLHLWEPTNKSTLGVKTKQTARERRRCAHSHRPRSHS